MVLSGEPSGAEAGGAPADALLERLKAGDERALADAFDQHRDRLWRTIQFRLDRRLAPRVDPEDVLQEAYLGAAQRLAHLMKEPTWSLYLWLRWIVLQTLVDVHRRHLGAGRRNISREATRVAAGESPSTSVSLAGQLAGSMTPPSQAAARAELRVRLEAALATMAPLDQEIIALRHFEDLSNVEAASVLGLQPTAASNRYVRAIARLKEVLSAAGWTESI